MKRSVAVTIAGQRYTIKSDAEEAYVQSLADLVDQKVRDVQRGVDIGRITAKFHNTVSAAIVETCCQLRQNGAPRQICLGGGTFQNVYLIERLLPALAKHGFEVFLNSLVPSNDGGISLGQTLVANAIIQRGG